MDFKKFKEKYFGKTYDEIKEELIKEENFWKNDKDVVSICLDVDRLIRQILEIEKDYPALFLMKKKMLILRYIYENFTTLESIPEDDEFSNYDIIVERVIYQINSGAALVKEMTEEGIEETRMIILEELYKIFKDGLPTIEEMEGLKTSLGDIFSDESPEKLQMIEEILAFNDPMMKQIKEAVSIEKDKVMLSDDKK